jgi:O-antigen/teichoic acid export membrane protein
MLQHGSSFLVLNLILYLQPTIDAYFLERFASANSIGWYAAARKLVNPLIFPVSALIAALYPTLCRLWSADQEEYRRVAQGALRASVMITVPIALGCALYAELGISLFSREAYGPAKDNLRILAAYILILYLTMVVGTCINAAGKQRSWTILQSTCLVIAAVADPILVPWFEKHAGNGGLGVNLTTVASELLMLVAGVCIAPRGIMDRAFARTAVLTAFAGAVMACVALLLSNINPWIAAPISVAAYVAALVGVGVLDRGQIAALRSLFARNR